MLVGAPTGIEVPVLDPGIFPPCSKPAEMEPQDIFTSEHREFRNYPGVEEQQITDDELAAHLQKNHIAAFDSLEEEEDNEEKVRICKRILDEVQSNCTENAFQRSN